MKLNNEVKKFGNFKRTIWKKKKNVHMGKFMGKMYIWENFILLENLLFDRKRLKLI